MVLSSGLVACVAAWDEYIATPSLAVRGNRFILGLAVCGFFVAAGAYVFLRTLPGPEYIRVDSGGIMMRYHGGRAVQILWTQPNLRLQVRRTDGFTFQGARRPASTWLDGGFPSPKIFPPEVYDEILHQSRAAGLSVTPAPSLSRYFSKVVISR